MILQIEQTFNESVDTNTVYLFMKNNYLPSSRKENVSLLTVEQVLRFIQ
jgi:hypothetical protein